MHGKPHKFDNPDIRGITTSIHSHDRKTKYIGQRKTFHDPDVTVLHHRTKCAWAAFMRQRLELTSRIYPLKDRSKRFDAAVTPVIMYTQQEHGLQLRH